MTNTNLFFVFGLLNSSGEIFSGKKTYSSIIDGGKKAKAFYESLGFSSIKTVSCHGTVLVKDSNDRLLSFVTPVGHTIKENCTEKEYGTVYWAWKEVKRQAEAVAEKAAAKKASVKVDAKVEEGREVATDKKESTTIKGSVEVGSPQQKKTTYYAIRKGRTVGIFTDWGETFELVNGYSGAEFKKFSVLSDAEEYLKGGNNE